MKYPRSFRPCRGALSIVLGLALVSLLVPWTVRAQSAATNVFAGSISAPGERDVFTFNLTNRARFAFDALTNIATLNWSLEGPAGLLVDRRSFTSSDAGSSSVLALTPGFHRLIVDSDDANTNSYAFRLLELSGAALLTPGTIVSNVLNPGNETRAFQFNSAAGDQLFFDRQFISPGQSIWWRLIDPYGNEVFGSAFNDANAVTQRVAGTYTLLIEGFVSNDRPVTNSFVVIPQGNTPPLPFTGLPLTIGTVVAGSLTNASTHAYVFSLGSDARLLLDSLTNSPGVQWFLEGPPGLVVNSRALNGTDWNAGSGGILDLPPGSYQLRVRRSIAGSVPYQFRLLDLDKASPLVLGTPVNASLSNTTATSLYQFNASAGARFYFDFNATNAPVNAQWELFSPLGTALAGASISTDRGPLTMPFTGTYLLAVEGYYGDDPGLRAHAFNVRPVTNTTEAMTIGAVIAGSISTPGQSRQFLFSLNATARLYFDARTNSVLRWTLAGPDGVVVNLRAFNSADANHPVLSLPPGDYSLTVTGTGDDVGGFAFRLLDLDQAPLFTTGLAVTGSINPPGETDAYRFEAGAGAKLFFNLVSASGLLNTSWRCVGPRGNEIFSGFIADRGPITLPVAGLYALLIEGHLADPISAYVFQVTSVRDASQPLTIGEVVRGAVAHAGQVQGHAFTLAAPARLYFDSLTNSTLRCSLDGPGGRLINNRLFNVSDGHQPSLNLPAGDYVLSVSGAGDELGEYAFALRDLASAVPLSPGSTASGALAPANETDLHRFTAPAGGRFFFDVLSVSAIPGARWRCFDAYGGEVFGGPLTDVGPITLSAGGLYTLAVEGSHADSAPGSYAINVRPVIDTVQPLALGALTTGAIDGPGQAAHHEFTVAVSGRFYLDSRVNSALRLTLTGPLGVMFANRRFDAGDATVDPLWLDPGRYTLTVTGAGDATGPYQFRLFDLATGTLLSPGSAVGGTLSPVDETDVYRFVASAGDRYFFDWISRTGAPNSQWRLFDPQGRRIFSANFNGDQGTNRLLLAGTYTLLIEGYFGDTGSGAYQFNVVPAGNVPLPAFSGTPIVPGQTVSSSLPDATTTNAFTFSLGAPARLLFDSLANSAATWSLQHAGGTLVNNRGFAQSDSSDGNPVLDLPAGSYQLTVRGAAGPYAYRLLNAATATAFTPGSIVTNSVQPARATALLTFTANAGDRFYFDGRARAGFSTEAYSRVLPPGGAALGPAFGITSDLEPFTVPIAGEYLMTVEGRATDTGAQGDFSFLLQPVLDETNTLTIGQTITGAIAHAGQQQVHRFALGAPARLFFDTLTDEAAANGLKWSLRGPPGTIVNARPFWAADSADGFSMLNLPAGDYALTVDADAAATPAYAFRLIDSSAATAIIPGTLVAGTLAPGAATVLHRFQATAGERFYFDGRGRTNLTAVPHVRIVSPLGADLSGAVRVDADFGVFTAPLSGDYLLSVEGRYTETSTNGGYSFLLHRVIDGTQTLTLGATAAGAIELPGQAQSYQLTLPAPTRVYFDTLLDSPLQCTINGPAGLVFDRQLWNSDSVDGFPVLDLGAGDHVIRIAGNGAVTGRYAFRLLDAATAVPFTPGGLVTNSISPATGTALWQCTAAAGERFYYDGRARSGFSTAPYLRILTPNGRPWIDPIRADSDLSPLIIPQTGSYLLSVEGRYSDTGSNGSYSFLLSPIPPNAPTPLFQTNAAPDLVIANLALNPASDLQSGQSATATWFTRNGGGAATTGSFTERVSVRHTGTGRLLFSRTLTYEENLQGAILPGEGRNRQISLTLPDGPDSVGLLELTVVTDSANVLFEQNSAGAGEANNSGSLAFTTSLAPYPDLQIASLTLSPAAAWPTGSLVTAHWILTNSGARATTGSWSETLVVRNTRTGQIIANQSADYDPAAVAPGGASPGQALGDLAPGDSRQRSLSFIVPASSQAYGTFEVSVSTDSDSRVFEFNAAGTAEANNAQVALSRSAPDLTVGGLTATAAPAARAGADLQLQWTITNQGNVHADGVFYDRVVIRNTNTAEVLLNTSLPYQPAAGQGAIVPGSSRLRTHSFRLPEGTRAVGRLEIAITTDVFDQLMEENADGTGEANNTVQAQLQIAPAPYPDLVVTNISLPATGRPGQSVPLVWTIRNAGSVPATGPWSDHVFLSSDPTIGNDQFLTSVFFTGSLAAGQSITRTQQVTLPGFGTGQRFAVVETDASDVVFEENDANNQAIATTTLTIPAALALSLTPAAVLESAGAQAVLATVTRNSDASAALAVSVSVAPAQNPTARLLAPPLVTIPAGASAASFFVGVENDAIAGATSTNGISVAAPGHVPATNTFTITDDDLPALTLRLDAASLAENGGPATATLTRNAETNTALIVSLFNDRPGSLNLPAAVTIPAGRTNATFTVSPINDAIVSGPRTVAIHASATNYPGASVRLNLLDDDTVGLTLQLSETSVAENKLNPAATAVVTRSPVSSAPQRVRLRVSAASHLQIADEVTIPANQPAVSFAVNVIDDLLARGAQSVDLIAEGLTDRGSPVPGATATSTLLILENDGPALSVNFDRAVIAEGTTTIATITRNTPATNALFVTLSAQPAGQLSLPSSVLIAPGQTSSNVVVTGLVDGQSDGVQEVTISANSPGFNSGRAPLSITDINVPDLAVSEVSASTNVLTEATLTVVWSVTNSGLASALGAWTDEIQLARDAQGINTTLLTTATNQGPLLAGESYTVSRTFAAPVEPGVYWLLVRTDAGRHLAEGSERNNAALSLPIVVQPSYRATVDTEIDAAVSGTPIPVSGRTFFSADGSPAPFRTATVWVHVNQTRRTFSVLSDRNGRFSGVFRPIPGEAGLYTLGADHPSVAADPIQDQFTLLGLGALPWELNLRLNPNTPARGQVELRNLSPLPLTGITVTPEGLPLDFNVTATTTNLLVGQGTNVLEYEISSSLATPVSGRFHLVIASLEGATLRLPIDFTVTPPAARLTATPGSLEAGMLRGTQTLVQIDVANDGGAPSGELEVALPVVPWLTLASASPLPSLPPGGRHPIVLALNPAADLPLGRYDGTLVIHTRSGSSPGAAASSGVNVNVSVSVPFQFRALSAARGDVRLTVTDEHTYYASGAPRVTNALVTLRDPFTSEVVTNGTSDAQGELTFRDLPEGTYQLEAVAARRSLTRGGVRISPGITTEQEVFMLRQEVTYEWRVVPSVITDHYRVVLEPQFETEVPQPNLVVENPEIVPLVFPGRTSQFAIRLRNTGLISLQRVRIPTPSHPNYIITPLVSEIEELPAQTTISVPVTIRTRAGNGGGGGGVGGDGFSLAGAPPSCPGDDCVIQLPIDTRFRCGKNFVTKTATVTLHAVCVPETGCDFAPFLDSSSPTFFEDNVRANRAAMECLLGNLDECDKARIRGYQRSGDLGSVFFPPGALPPPLDGTNFGLSAFCACGPQATTNTLFMFGTNLLNSLGFPNSGGAGSTFSFVAATIPGPCNAPAGSGAGGSLEPAFQPAANGAGSGTGAGPGVCARVRLELSQDITMTRAAFRGTLVIDHGGATDLTGIQLGVEFRDANGQPASERFVVRGPTLTGLTAINGQGRLPAGQNGTADFLFIPTLDAAPLAPAAYQIGGTLRFTLDGQDLTVPLLPGQITVLPEARLHLDYFQQRDVFSDDPFTPELEPAEPFALGLRIRNAGAGTARNFQIASAAPRIQENEKGLLVDFQLLGARVDDRPFTPSFNLNVGDIDPNRSRVVVWDMTSSLQGKFIDYRASFTHVDAFGATNLSLIDRVSIHELIHAVRDDRSGADALPDFLVNDQPDPDNLPDTLYLSSGSNAPVALGQDPNVSEPVTDTNPQVELTANMPAGWAYLRLPNPGPGLRLIGVRRSDGRTLRSPENAWTTDRTFPSSIPGARREHTLHLFDHDSTGRYTLTFAPADRDTNAPTSAVAALPASSPTSFAVEWDGADQPGGSGLAHFDIFVSVNGGAYSNWLARTTQRSALFTATLGQTYAFYSRATGLAGNTEIIPAIADAQTVASALNTPPSLLPISDVTLDEGAALSLRPTAFDTDLPRQALTYRLLSAPAGTTLDSIEGVVRWNPGETDGGSSNQVIIVVTDNGVPSLSATQSFAVIVRELNSAPVFVEANPDLALDEDTVLSVPVAATDADRPNQTLTWQLEPGAPFGLSVGANTGLLQWLPGESRGPGEYLVTVTVRDNGSPARSASRTIRIFVREANQPPNLAPVAPQAALVQNTLLVPNSATDPDVPAQQLFFSLAPGAPRGARIHRATGLFTWTPPADYARTTNSVTVQVTDNGVPSLTSRQTFTIVVGDLLQVQLGSGPVAAGNVGRIPVVVDATVPTIRATLTFEAADPRLGSFALEPTPSTSNASLEPLGNDQFRIRLEAPVGQAWSGTITVAHLRFAATPAHASAFVALPVSAVAGLQSDGQPVPRAVGYPGRVAYVGAEPLLELDLTPPAAPARLRLYGQPGPPHTIESTTQMAVPPTSLWTPYWTGSISNLVETLTVQPTNQTRLFRARRP